MSKARKTINHEPNPVNTPRRFARNRDWFLAAAIALAAIAVLWPVVTCDFVNYDDPIWVTENYHVQQGLSLANIGWAFRQAYGYWTPIDVMSHMLDCQLFGLNPAGHHLTNLLFHVCNAVLLFLLLRRMTGRPWCSVLAAGLFAVHPLNVEPVAWITGRKDVLSTLFGLLAFLAYARYAAKTGLARYLPVMLFLTLSLMVKPALMPFPVLLLLLDYWPLNRFDGIRIQGAAGRKRLYRLAAEKIPLLAIVLAFTAVDFVTQKQFGGISEKHPFAERACHAVTAYLAYLGKAVWPLHLAIPYPYPARAAWGHAAVALAVLAALTVAAILGRKRFPCVFVGWFWYGMVLFPVCGLLVQIGDFAMADRYAYVSMIGIFVAVIWLLADATAGRALLKKGLLAAYCLVVVAFGVLAFAQTKTWKNSIALGEHALRVTTRNAPAENNLAIALHLAGRKAEAIAHCREALEVHPRSLTALTNLGIFLADAGDLEGAVDQYKKAIAFKPNSVKGYNNLGIALAAMGKHEEAIEQFKKVLTLDPDYARARVGIGDSLVQLNKLADAETEYKTVLTKEPVNPYALSSLAKLRAKQGKFAEARACWDRILQINPTDANAHNGLAGLLSEMGKKEDAEAQYRRAIALDPNLVEAYADLGFLLAGVGRLDEAIDVYQNGFAITRKEEIAPSALGAKLEAADKKELATQVYNKIIRRDPKAIGARLGLARLLVAQGDLAQGQNLYNQVLAIAPSNRDAHFNLAVLLEFQGKPREAISHYEETLKIDPNDQDALRRLANLKRKM